MLEIEKDYATGVIGRSTQVFGSRFVAPFDAQ